MAMVRISETYDLSTQVDKMGIIGIHTPSATAITRAWGGLFQNYRYQKLVGCDVTLACASMLPADPLSVGTEAGAIAPQDMFNPILYTAVSNDSFNTIQNRIMHGTSVGSSIEQADTGIPASQSSHFDDWNVYYGLLADPDGWAKAMPQSGLQMKGLFPIVYSVVNNYGNANFIKNTADGTLGNYKVDVTPASSGSASRVDVTHADGGFKTFRGPSMRMPRLPTKSPTSTDGEGSYSVEYQNVSFPTTYVACIITPPAKLHKLYYRMKVTWTIEFEELRPLTEVSMYTLNEVGKNTYASDYAEQSSKMANKESTVDSLNTTLELVMESTR